MKNTLACCCLLLLSLLCSISSAQTTCHMETSCHWEIGPGGTQIQVCHTEQICVSTPAPGLPGGPNGPNVPGGPSCPPSCYPFCPQNDWPWWVIETSLRFPERPDFHAKPFKEETPAVNRAIAEGL